MNLGYRGERHQGYGWSFDYQREHDFVYLPSSKGSLDFIYKTESSDEIKAWVDQTTQGLQKSELRMERIEGDEAGIGGTYFCIDRLRNRYSVFKPFDEEARALHDPHSDRCSTGPIEGTKAGKGAAREIAAYLLDHPTKSVRRVGFVGQVEGFCGVPPTVPVWCLTRTFKFPYIDHVIGHYKFGSLQKYMESNGNCSGVDDRELEDYEVQKICLLDIRFANADRHFGNLLHKKEDNGKIKLIPIDHGYCFPENFKACKFNWLNWNKSKNMFNPEIIEYIESLDAGEDIELLRRNRFTMS